MKLPAHELATFFWFESWIDLSESKIFDFDAMINESTVVAQQAEVTGFCDVCNSPTTFRVEKKTTFNGAPNLREDLFCQTCRLSNRSRLLYFSVDQWLQSVSKSGLEMAALESTTRFYKYLRNKYRVIGSEYLSSGHVSGKYYLYRPFRSLLRLRKPYTRHESITNLSFNDGELGAIVHSDVLEHVPDHICALRECHRVLHQGGMVFFTVPFSIYRKENILRAILKSDGSLEHLTKPEYHLDGIHPAGALAFHSFGWQLLQQMREIGFTKVNVGICWNAFHGFCSNNHPTTDGFMPPLVIRAIK